MHDRLKECVTELLFNGYTRRTIVKMVEDICRDILRLRGCDK